MPMTGATQSTPEAAAVATQGGSTKEFKETRLQIRLASGGQPFTTTLPSEARVYSIFFLSIW